MEIVRETARELHTEACATNERRLLVIEGHRKRCYEAAVAVAELVESARSTATLSDHDLVGEHVTFERSETLLGTTYDCIVLDCHDTCQPNAIGRATGAVDGGGLLLMLVPTLEKWRTSYDRFDESIAAPPYSNEDVGHRFKRRLIRTLQSHRGIAIVDVDRDRLVKHGRTDPPPSRPPDSIQPPKSPSFPDAVYAACRSADQRDAVRACERLTEPNTAVVLTADRGRGKSGAAGLAAAAFAADGDDVLVTAPGYRNAAELFDRAAATLKSLGALTVDGRDGDSSPFLRTTNGEIRFETSGQAIESSADVLFVDEAAALSVRRLEELLPVAPSICFATTVRGYEGSGRGFDVRFRESLENSHAVTDCILSEPIRYASGDPIEVWVFHALLLGASPPADQLVVDSHPTDVEYERFDRAVLVDDDALLGELFGLLVSAHYRTQPDDLARLLDAANVAVRALTVDGHPVSVAMVAREGGFDVQTRRTVYEGERIRGNLIPDLLTSQLRDPEAGGPTGLRVVRIATHNAARSRGFGSKLLSEIEMEFARSDGSESERFGAIDYLSTSYGATSDLLSFWRSNGYGMVHLSTTRNEASGERSAVMLRPLSEAGVRLTDRHTAWFTRRFPDVLSTVLDSVDPDVVRAVLESIDGTVPLELDDFEWRLVASSIAGPGRYDTAPGPFRRLAFKSLVDGVLDDPTAERLLVVKALQEHTWDETTDRLGYVSRRECARTFGAVYEPIVDRYGNRVARAEIDRYRRD